MPPSHLARAHATLILLLACQSGRADGFDTFSRHEDLHNHVVVDSGDLERVSPPIGMLGSSDVLRMKANCFEAVGSLGLWSYGKKAGLILVDKEKSIKVAILESGIGSIKVQVTSVIQVSCPTSESGGLPTDPQQRLQELRRKQEALQRELERLRQQAK